MELITIENLGEITPTKENAQNVAAKLAAAVKHGETDPAEFAIRAEFIAKAMTEARKLVQEDVLRYVGEKGVTMLGAKVEQGETVKYDYAQNETWSKLEAEISALKEKQKAVEESIKMASRIGHSIIDEDSGEIIAAPVQVLRTPTLKITLGK